MKEKQTLDKITIRDLFLRCIIGTNQEERRDKQDVLINIEFFADLKRACKSDQFEETLDYKAIKKSVIKLVENSSFFLIEKLAEAVAEKCLENPMVKMVKVTLDKPGALRFSRSVAVEIVRSKD